MDCRYCKEPILEGQPTTSVTPYWHGPFRDISHKDCFQKGYAEEAFDCQVIDADCNDCKFFTAYPKEDPKYIGPRVKLPVISDFENPAEYDLAILDFRIRSRVRSGRCGKFDKDVVAKPNQCTGMSCFVHRKWK